MYFENWEVRDGYVVDSETGQKVKRQNAQGTKARHFSDTIEIGHMLENYKFEGE